MSIDADLLDRAAGTFGRDLLQAFDSARGVPTGEGAVDGDAIRGDDLYVITVSALYLFPGGVTRRAELTPKRLIWGVPLWHVHQCPQRECLPRASRGGCSARALPRQHLPACPLNRR